jgi:hypothetical protein
MYSYHEKKNSSWGRSFFLLRLSSMLLRTCRFSQAAFVRGRSFPATSTRSLLSQSLRCYRYSQKISKVAEASNEWPEDKDLPSWVATDWQVDAIDATSAVPLQGPPWTVTVANDAPVWEQIFAQVWPRDDACTVPVAFVVQPAFAFLAPVGGCDNLCNENERYSDSCTFTVNALNLNPPLDKSAKWLLIRTEESDSGPIAFFPGATD